MNQYLFSFLTRILPVSLLSLGLIIGYTGCGVSSSDQAQVWILHDVPDLANIEMVINDRALLEVSPGELTQVTFNLQTAALQFRNSGAAPILIQSSEIEFENQAYFFALRGSIEHGLSLIEIAEPITNQVSNTNHHLTLLNLADPSLAFNVYQEDQNLISIDPLMPDMLPTSMSLPIQTGQNLTLSTDHVPNSANNSVVSDFFAGEASLLLITSQATQSEPDTSSDLTQTYTLDLTLIPLSIYSDSNLN